MTDDRPVSVWEYEERARALLPTMAFDYYAGGSEDERTIADNRAAFSRFVLRPRVLVDVAERDTSTTVLGTPVGMPVLVSPTALHALAHPEGEVETAVAVRVRVSRCRRSPPHGPAAGFAR